MKLFRMMLTGIMLLGLTSVAIAQQKDSDDGGTPGPSFCGRDQIDRHGSSGGS